MTLVVQGAAPADDEAEKRAYLLKKLEEARKDCQWILTLGAASVLGVVIKDGFGSSSPGLKLIVSITSVLQIFISMVGSLSWWQSEIDQSQVVGALHRRLRARVLLRNLAVVLLGISIVMIAILGWLTARPPSK